MREAKQKCKLKVIERRFSIREQLSDDFGAFEIWKSHGDLEKYPKVSIVMSVFNGAWCVRDAIRSILDQEMCDYEFIIINDGSTDETETVVREFDDERIIYIRSSNIGLTRELVRGTRIAKGKYVARQDADDKSLKNRLSIQLSVIEKYGLDILSTRCIVDGKVKPNALNLICKNEKSFLLGNKFVHGSFLIRRKALRKVNYDPNLVYAQDFRLILDFIRIGLSVGVLKDPLYVLGENSKRISVKSCDAQNDCAIEVIKQHFNGNAFIFRWLNKIGWAPLRSVVRTVILGFIWSCSVGRIGVFEYIKNSESHPQKTVSRKQCFDWKNSA